MLDIEKLDQLHGRLGEQLKEVGTLFAATFTLQAGVPLVPADGNHENDTAIGDGWFLGFRDHRTAPQQLQLYVYSLDPSGQTAKIYLAHETPQGIRALAALQVPALYGLLATAESRLIEAHESAAEGLTSFLVSHGVPIVDVGDRDITQDKVEE